MAKKDVALNSVAAYLDGEMLNAYNASGRGADYAEKLNDAKDDKQRNKIEKEHETDIYGYASDTLNIELYGPNGNLYLDPSPDSFYGQYTAAQQMQDSYDTQLAGLKNGDKKNSGLDKLNKDAEKYRSDHPTADLDKDIYYQNIMNEITEKQTKYDSLSALKENYDYKVDWMGNKNEMLKAKEQYIMAMSLNNHDAANGHAETFDAYYKDYMVSRYGNHKPATPSGYSSSLEYNEWQKDWKDFAAYCETTGVDLKNFCQQRGMDISLAPSSIFENETQTEKPAETKPAADIETFEETKVPLAESPEENKPNPYAFPSQSEWEANTPGVSEMVWQGRDAKYREDKRRFVSSVNQKAVDDLAAGKYGEGEERYKKLEEAGYDVSAIKSIEATRAEKAKQAEAEQAKNEAAKDPTQMSVEERYQHAYDTTERLENETDDAFKARCDKATDKVIAEDIWNKGMYGTGEDRKAALGEHYRAVQDTINETYCSNKSAQNEKINLDPGMNIKSNEKTLSEQEMKDGMQTASLDSNTSSGKKTGTRREVASTSATTTLERTSPNTVENKPAVAAESEGPKQTKTGSSYDTLYKDLYKDIDRMEGENDTDYAARCKRAEAYYKTVDEYVKACKEYDEANGLDPKTSDTFKTLYKNSDEFNAEVGGGVAGAKKALIEGYVSAVELNDSPENYTDVDFEAGMTIDGLGRSSNTEGPSANTAKIKKKDKKPSKKDDLVHAYWEREVSEGPHYDYWNYPNTSSNKSGKNNNVPDSSRYAPAIDDPALNTNSGTSKTNEDQLNR